MGPIRREDIPIRAKEMADALLKLASLRQQSSSSSTAAPAKAESKILFGNKRAKVNGNTRFFKIKGNLLKCYGGSWDREQEKINLDNVLKLKKTGDSEITINMKGAELSYKITDNVITAMRVAQYLRKCGKLQPNQVDWTSFGENTPVAVVSRRRRLLQQSRARRRRLLERLQGF